MRGAGVFLLLAAAVRVFLNRYQMLVSQHGFLTGINWVDEHIRLPLTWLLIACLVAGTVFVWMRLWRLLLLIPVAMLVAGVVPAAISTLYVR
ncbi:MAG: UPF0182 family protein [Bryobacteraceae bacterium]